jgi:nitrate/nitrite-specific signal transduction histidine kinase
MLVVSKIIDPLKKLTEVALQNKQGKYQYKFDIKGSDEFTNLGFALNSMTDELVKSKQDMDKKIIQRTKQLEKINKFMLGRELRIVELKKEIQVLKNKFKIK